MYNLASLVISCLFQNRHPNRCDVLPHCGFDGLVFLVTSPHSEATQESPGVTSLEQKTPQSPRKFQRIYKLCVSNRVKRPNTETTKKNKKHLSYCSDH